MEESINLKGGKTALRVLFYLLVAIPGGLFYLLNEIGVENQTFLLIFAQILPFFLIPLGPFAFGDSVCLKFKLLEES